MRACVAVFVWLCPCDVAGVAVSVWLCVRVRVAVSLCICVCVTSPLCQAMDAIAAQISGDEEDDYADLPHSMTRTLYLGNRFQTSRF